MEIQAFAYKILAAYDQKVTKHRFGTLSFSILIRHYIKL